MYKCIYVHTVLTPGCIVNDLLLNGTDPVCRTSMSDGTCNEWMVCSEDGCRCASFSGTSIGDMADYSTSSDCCIDSGPLTRTCMANEKWSSEIPHTINTGK